MINPILLLQAWQYYHYYTLGLAVYNGVHYSGKAVSLTGKVASSITNLVRTDPRQKTDKKIVKLIKEGKKEKVIKDDWELIV